MLSAEFPSQVPVYVLVGDSGRIYSHLLAEALKRDPRLRIAGSASSSHEFLEMAARTNPDVVVISANLDDNPAGGMAALREFYETHPQTPSVMLLDSLNGSSFSRLSARALAASSANTSLPKLSASASAWFSKGRSGPAARK